jgi:hypothetical protein
MSPDDGLPDGRFYAIFSCNTVFMDVILLGARICSASRLSRVGRLVSEGPVSADQIAAGAFPEQPRRVP